MLTFLKQKPFVIPVAILLGILFYFPLFMHLENLAIRSFDEGRLANNAYEMSRNGNYIVTYFEGQPDLWNTKPPLMIWAQVLCIKVFGYNELAIRLPAALAALMTCIVLIIFSARFLEKPLPGIIAAGILITSSGFIGIHFSRTGDYDALLTLFTTLYVLCFFIYCESNEKTTKDKFIALFFLFLALAVLTKGVAGLLFTPALLIFALARRQAIPLLKNKRSYIFGLGFIALIAAYYLIRESMNPGYMRAVFENELGGRFLTTIENHKHGPMYYYDFIVDHAFRHWYLFVIPGILLGFVSKEDRMRNLAVLVFLVITSYVFIISRAETKIHWYVMPVFPFLALSVAMFFYWVVNVLEKISEFFPAAQKNVAPYILLFFVFWKPYNDIFNSIYHPKEEGYRLMDSANTSYYLRDAAWGKRNLSGNSFLHEDNRADLVFYAHLLEEKEQKIKFINRDEVTVNDTIIVYAENLKIFIGNKFETEVIDQWKNVDRYRIIAECPQ